MEESKQVFFETRRHASRPYTSNYPPHIPQLNNGSKGGFLTRGLSQLKERWSDYRQPTRLRKCATLFVSPSSDLVAVASGSQITILRKDGRYQEPYGTFTCGNKGVFIHGAWSEGHDIFGVTDDADVVYFIKANGEEISRLTKKHLKVSSSIIGLIAQDNTDMKGSCLCQFSIATSDGSLHQIEISPDPYASIVSSDTFISSLLLKHHLSQNLFCVDYHKTLPIFATISETGSTHLARSSDLGSYSVSLWRRSSKSNVEHLVSAQFEGLFSKPKDYVGQLTFPKVLVSPQGNHVACLDARGGLLIFKFDDKQCSLTKLVDDREQRSQVNDDTRNGECCVNIADFTWWSDDIISIANMTGTVTMFNIFTGDKVLENDFVYSMPLLERAPQLDGYLFLLESTSTEVNGGRNSNLVQHAVDGWDTSKSGGLQWSLFTFTKRTLPDMYNVLISNQEYQAALDFASRHTLDKDEVLKSQWLHSLQGVDEINKFLSSINDQVFILSECVNQVGPSEAAVRALLTLGLQVTDCYRFSEFDEDECSQVWDFRVARLNLLHLRDRLETFIGINMGRYTLQEFKMFRDLPMKEPAIALAESGKIGALNLLFKRHFYSLAPVMLDVLAAIPETVHVQSYSQLLPGSSSPSISMRQTDWVECSQTISFISSRSEIYGNNIHVRTEYVVKQCIGFQWPSITELELWYKTRARSIDTLSGQLENCMCLIELAFNKGLSSLQQFLEDVSYLHQLIYSDGSEGLDFSMNLIAWEQLSDYDKFKSMLIGVNEKNLIDRLNRRGIPFMQKRFHSFSVTSNASTGISSTIDKKTDSFLVRWLKEIAAENKLDMCLLVIEDGCRHTQSGLFTDDTEILDCALQCIYLCSASDKWSTMASILSKLPHPRDFEGVEEMKRRLKVAEGHVEAGRLLALYQVPKPIGFILEADFDEKGVKQILRLILSKFIRRQTGRLDAEWANMWRDLQSLQEKAFPFLDMEFLLIEFCRGLLKAGKFSLARNYLKGAGPVALAAEKAESLVIQAAREYFFSASSLSCSEIWKAKECLNIFPNSRNVRAEADTIKAVTVKLPNLGVNLLPMQFRQIKDPMEIIKLAITSQPGAYLNVDELIEISKLLGLSSHDDISSVQEALAREAAVAGDLQLAFDLCLVLARKGHGSVWDLCAALARGPAQENMDISSRKQLLGFALSHCDGESIGELLNAWKDLDLQGQCDTLLALTGKEPYKYVTRGSSTLNYPPEISEGIVGMRDCSVEGNLNDIDTNNQGAQIEKMKKMLSEVAKNVSSDYANDLDSLLRENGKLSTFASLELPWLLELCRDTDCGQKSIPISASGKQHISVKTQAVVAILSWLARSGFAPRDDFIATLARSIMESPVTEEEDLLGFSYLLNLEDAFHGVEVIEEHVRTREKYNEISSIMDLGMLYSFLHSFEAECKDPYQKRKLLLKTFQQRNNPLKSDDRRKLDEAQSTFWKEWKLKLEEQKRVAEQSKVLEQIIPGVDTGRFISRDQDYINNVLSSLIESVKLQKKAILNNVINLANLYGLNRSKVVLHYISCILVSEFWSIEEIIAETSDFKEEICACAAESINVLSSVYAEIDGLEKQRLAYIYGLLSDCYLCLEERKESESILGQNFENLNNLGPADFYKITREECLRVSFIKDLNFKNIAGLTGLDYGCLNNEVLAHINEANVEALAQMVQSLVGTLRVPDSKGILSGQSVYAHHVESMLIVLEMRARSEIHHESPDVLLQFISELEHTYNLCRRFFGIMEIPGLWKEMTRFISIISHVDESWRDLCHDAMWQDCLIALLNFWVKLLSDIQDFEMDLTLDEKFSLKVPVTCLKSFLRLIISGKISTGQGWVTVFGYISNGLMGDLDVEILNFCRAMIFSGCEFDSVATVFSEAMSSGPDIGEGNQNNNIQGIRHLYVSILESILQEFSGGFIRREDLHSLISSLRKLEGDLENLRSARLAVWEKLAESSENLQLPSHMRVHLLELMQYISDNDRRRKGTSPLVHSYVLPWEGWEGLQCTNATHKNSTKDGLEEAAADGTNRFTSTLIALKSSQLVSTISRSLEITPEDLSTVESVVSCFRKVSDLALSESHIDSLLAMLKEWEHLFTTRETETDSSNLAEVENNWNNDDWDNEGWESFQEEPVEKESKEASVLSVHPLHACWALLFRKVIILSQFEGLIKLVDKSMAQTSQTLLDEGDVSSLSQALLELDCFLAVKFSLLFPYEAEQLRCMDACEDKLKHEGMSDKIGQDQELFALVLCSGIVSTVITKPCYDTTSSSLCCLVGIFSRQCQDALLSSHKHGISEDKNFIYLFTRLLLPCFLAELVKADQQILAAFLLSRFMHTDTSLSLISIAGASLRKYFERQLEMVQNDEILLDDTNCGSIVNSISGLRLRLGSLMRSSLSLLTVDVR